MFSIGEFSKITGLTVKTLRFYHEQGVLEPTCVDARTGYRYYGENKLETARVVSQLRRLDFSLVEIAEILSQHDDEADILDYLQRQKVSIEQRMQKYHDIRKSLDAIISKEREARTAMQNPEFEIEEKTLDTMLIAGVRMKGKYSDCGAGFAQIGKRFGRHICGKPMLLIYDQEYKEDDADFEACMPIRKGESDEGISIRSLPGGRCVSLLHRGPYEQLGQSYAKVLQYVKQKGYQIESPCREVYVKGPGMIFKGNPKKYLTEIQLVLSRSVT